MSGRSDVSSPSMSTTKRSMRHEEGADTVPETRGWLRKEGETLHNLYKRYMVLKGCTLSNHRNEEGSATWTVDMTQASVRTGPRKNEVVLSLPQKRISLFAADEADQARWVAAMKVAIAGGRSVDTHYKLGRLLGRAPLRRSGWPRTARRASTWRSRSLRSRSLRRRRWSTSGGRCRCAGTCFTPT